MPPQESLKTLWYEASTLTISLWLLLTIDLLRLPMEVQVKIMKTVVRSRLPHVLGLPFNILLNSRQITAAKLRDLVDQAMGPLRFKPHLRYDAARAVMLLRNMCFLEQLSLDQDDMNADISWWSGEHSPFELAHRADLRTTAKECCIMVTTENTLLPTADEFATLCTQFANRLKLFTDDASGYPNLDTLTLTLDAELKFYGQAEYERFQHIVDDLITTCIPAIRSLNIRHRRIILRFDQHGRTVDMSASCATPDLTSTSVADLVATFSRPARGMRDIAAFV
ncbi:hypothetical protein LTR08_003664 [Meristemomyces frigidus]|nr:hypothetical protein LTR08_003664 [Meristemomyces frigidus]